MGLAQKHSEAALFAEDIRLIIWDLDETFWDGTLTEGGIAYREDHHLLVEELTRRGIMSAICSKNDPDDVEAVLQKKGLWDTFIFPSIDWTPKGPRIAAMLKQVGLRARSVLFIDDNPMNLAQAAHINPGLNVALPSVIAKLRDAPQLWGKDDPDLGRLAQYKLKERKAQAEDVTDGDSISFLRGSGVKVFVDYDVEAHLDRAIELINRTNQLNFTKQRLPEDMTAARVELTALLASNTTDAALIRVTDNFGDYGHVGFYLTERMHNKRRVKHFCFSCRTLNMYIEHWAYTHLGRPPMKVVGEVLSDPVHDPVCVDWITPFAETESAAREQKVQFDQIFARGGCDLAALMHYFQLHSPKVVEELNHPKNGQMFRRDHTAFLMPALHEGLTPAQQEAAVSIGYDRADFDTGSHDMPADNTLCLLSFWADADIPEYRHKASGLRVPYWLVGAQNHDLIAKEELRNAVAETDLQRARLKVLCSEFEHIGLIDDTEMAQRYRRVLDAIPDTLPIVILLANERGPLHYRDPSRSDHPNHARQNVVLRTLAEGRPNVMLVDPADHITGAQDLLDLNHFKRPVYHRIYLEIIARLAAWLENETA
ncbi:MAG: hypothetical protein AB8B60_12315 [Sulfitobacter sp.]